MKFLADVAGVPQDDMERTWNCGIGMSAIVAADSADLIIRSLAARGMKAWVAGSVEKSEKSESGKSFLRSEYQRNLS
jgi:phosphoribosylformylglycinamidine cyclo-ligase